MTGPPVHALIAGAVADPASVGNALRRIGGLRAAGLVDRVVVSVGHELPRLGAAAPDAFFTVAPEVVVPLASQPPEGSAPPARRHILSGLADFPADAPVLLLDAAEPMVWFAFEQGIAAFAGLPQPAISPFSRRIVTGGSLPMHPFFVRDQALLGAAGDLANLVSGQQAMANAPASMWREQRWFAAPWAWRLPWLRPLFETVPPPFPGLSHEDGLRLHGTLLSSPLMLRAIHDSLVIQRDALHLGFLHPRDGEPAHPLATTPGATLRRFLGGIPFDRVPAMHSWKGFWTAEAFSSSRIGELLELPVHVARGPSLLDMFGGVLADAADASPAAWEEEAARLSGVLRELGLPAADAGAAS